MSPVFWVLVAAAAVIVELLSPAFVAAFAAAGGVAAAFAAGAGLPAVAQVGAFAAVTVLTLLAARRVLVTRFGGSAMHASWRGEDPIVGRRAVVTLPIEPGLRGQIQVGGERWTAVAYGGLPVVIPAGRDVEVMGVDGLVAQVIDPDAIGLTEVRDAPRVHG